MDLNWNDLRIVLAVARARSFQGAGRALRLSHTTVSRRILALEAQLGRPLFLRQARSCLPTADCTRLVAAAERTEEALRKVRNDIALPAAQTAPIRIVSVNWVFSAVLQPRLGALWSHAPGLRLHLDGTLSDQPPSGGDPVLALRFELPPNREETAVPVAQVGYAVYAPVGCRTPDDLPWISFHGSAPLDWLLNQGIAPAQIALLVSDGAAVRDVVRGGMGKGLLPECLAAGDPGLVRLSGPRPEFVRLLRAVGRWDFLTDPSVQTVVDWVEACFCSIGCGIADDRRDA